jgi:hypothetical protein
MAAERDGKGHGPSGYVDSLYIATMAAIGQIEHDHFDGSYIGPSGVGWQPTRRDWGDWLQAVGWLLRLPKPQRELIELRSLNPPYSYRQIGARMQPARSHEWVRRTYAKAIAALTKVANRPTAGGPWRKPGSGACSKQGPISRAK